MGGLIFSANDEITAFQTAFQMSSVPANAPHLFMEDQWMSAERACKWFTEPASGMF